MIGHQGLGSSIRVPTIGTRVDLNCPAFRQTPHYRILDVDRDVALPHL